MSTTPRMRAAVGAAALAAVTATLGSAQPASAATEAQRLAAATAVVEGTATANQRELVATDQELAAKVPVNYIVAPTTETRVSLDTTSDEAVAARRACPERTKYIVTTKGQVTAKSTLGFVTFRYHHKVKFCEGANRILAFLDRDQWFTDEDWVIDTQQLVVNSKTIWDDGSATSKVKRKVKYCIIQGCYATVYPWLRVRMVVGDQAWTGSADNQI